MKKLAASLVVLVCFSCAGRDMDKICPIAEEVFGDTALSDEAKAMKFGERVDDAVSSSAVRNIFGAIASASRDHKYELLQAGAAEVGRPDWSCPILEREFSKQLPDEEMEPELPPDIEELVDEIAPSSPKEGIGRVIRGASKEVRACYEKELLKNPELAGKLTVGFTIAVDGSVSEATIKDDALHAPEVASCILSVVRGQRFPATGEVQVVSYPFLFQTGF